MLKCTAGASEEQRRRRQKIFLCAAIFSKSDARAIFSDSALRKCGRTRNMISCILTLSKSPEDKELKIRKL